MAADNDTLVLSGRGWRGSDETVVARRAVSGTYEVEVTLSHLSDPVAVSEGLVYVGLGRSLRVYGRSAQGEWGSLGELSYEGSVIDIDRWGNGVAALIWLDNSPALSGQGGAVYEVSGNAETGELGQRLLTNVGVDSGLHASAQGDKLVVNAGWMGMTLIEHTESFSVTLPVGWR